MEDLKGRAFLQKKLRPGYVRYAAASIVFLIALTLALLSSHRAASLDDRASSLEDLRVRLARSRSAVKEVTLLINQADSVLPRDISSNPPSKALFAGLDRVKLIFGKAQLAIGKMETKADEVVIPINIAGPMDDYRMLAGQIGRLQELSFPFFTVAGLLLKKDRNEGGREGAVFEIRGFLRTPVMNADQRDGTSTRAQGG